MLGILVVCLAGWLAPGPRADIVILKTGDRVVGLVRDVPTQPNRVLLITATGEVVIPRDQIAEHTEESVSTGWRRIAQVHMESGRWEQALDALEKASKADPVDPEVSKLIQDVREKLVQDSLSRLEAQRALSRQRLNEVQSLIEQESFENAQQLLDEVKATSPTAEIQERWQRLSASLQVAWGIDREDKLDYSGATTHFQSALDYDPDNTVARDHLLSLWADDPTRREEVIAGYQRKLESNPDDLLAVRKLADTYLANGEIEKALPYLEKIVDSGKFDSFGYENQLATAYANLSSQAAKNRNYDKAIQLYREYLQKYPGADPRPLYFYQYLKQYESTDPTDYDARAELARFLKEKGMNTQALQEIQTILEQAPENQAALSMLRDYAQQELDEARQDYQQGRYGMAMAGAQRITQSYTSLPEIIEQASDLYTRSDIELKRLERERKNQARELITLGDQYYQQAYDYANQMKITDRDRSTRIINYRNEAIKFTRRAMEAYQQAVRIDPNVGTMAGGDVNNKIRDLQQLYRGLTEPPIPIPRVNRRE